MSDIGRDGWPTDTAVIRGRDREIESLRSRLAEAEALLREARTLTTNGTGLAVRIDAHLARKP